MSDFRKKFSIAILAILSIFQPAFADPIEIEASAGVSSMLIDRGETLATLNNELSLTVSKEVSSGSIYGALYRITPLGDDRSAFNEEVDYTLGFSGGDMISYDISANYLTFPGSTDTASLELAAEFGIANDWSPTLATFYDVDLDIYGAEVSVGPTQNIGPWAIGLLVRSGFVSSDDVDYSYAGLEVTTARDLSEALGFEVFARAEMADEDTFSSQIRDRDITEFSQNGLGAGIRLTARR